MLVLQLLQTEAHPTDEGEGPGGQDGRHPAGATGESTQGHCQSQLAAVSFSMLKARKYLVSWVVDDWW